MSQKLILIKASTLQVVEAASDLGLVQTFEAKAYGTTVTVNAGACVAYRLREHSWGILDALKFVSTFNAQDFVCPVSQKLQTKGILFEHSDTSGILRYALFQSGNFLESFEFNPSGLEDEFQAQDPEEDSCKLKFRYLDEFQEQDYEGQIPFEFNCYFQSCLRSLRVEDIGEPYEFANHFLEDQDLYVPGLEWLIERVQEGDKLSLQVEGLSSNDFEEIYYMSFK